MPTLSIITVAYNETMNLSRLKKSLDRLIVPPDWICETVLVDNASTDDTGDRARALGFDQVLVVAGSIAAGRNAGYKAAAGSLLIFTDADCEVAPDWLERMVAGQGRRAGMLGWPVEPPQPMTWVQSAWHAHWTYKRGAIQDETEGESAITLITSANMSITRSAMERVGGFDEALVSGEDMNLLLRALQAGIQVVAQPGLRVIHHGEPRTLRDYYRQQAWHCSKSSFRQIIQQGGLKGANAVWYTLLFGISMLLAGAGMIAAILLRSAFLLLATLPLLILITLPAAVIALRSRRPALLIRLPVLYAIYGVVRVRDMLGWSARPKSWRAVNGPTAGS